MEMKTKYYFESNEFQEDEICYSLDYFINRMKSEGIKNMNLCKAIPERRSDVAWCKHEGFLIEDSEETCGKQCRVYSPRNGKSGCCKYYTKTLYVHGDRVVLNIDGVINKIIVKC
jgi:hypothetical protein